MNTCTKKIAIYRCVFGGYDIVLDECVVIPEADYYLFTDDRSLKVYPYKNILITDDRNTPSITNRSLKLIVPEILTSYDATIYLDGNIGVFSKLTTLIDEFIGSNADLGLFTHPNHSSLDEEIELCILKNKASKSDLRAEIEFYSESLTPKVEKFSDNSILFRKQPNQNITAAMADWFGDQAGEDT